MANIAVFHMSPIIYNQEWQSLCYYDSFISSLVEQGNNVVQFITNDFLRKAWSGMNEPRHEDYSDQVVEELRNFKPDLVITFNHSFLKGLEKILTCPIAIWEADSISYFCDTDTIRANPERYHFIAFSDFGLRDFNMKLNAPSHQTHRIRNATAVKNKATEKKYNISFIGTHFQIPRNVMMILRKHPTEMLNIIRIIEDTSEEHAITVMKEHGISPKDLPTADVLFCKTGQIRNQILDLVSPLGLTIFGDPAWKNCYPFSLNLALAYHDDLVFSLEHNQTVYNQSKIAINISHGQAVTAYPWRVLDILASDAVLVSDSKKDLVADFGNKVPLQLYQSPVESYEICQKLLKDQPMRDDIVAQANAAIEENYRWHHRFPELENIFSIQLFHPGKTGTYKIFQVKERKLDILMQMMVHKGANGLATLKSQKKTISFKKKGISKLLDILPNALYFAIYKIYSTKKSANRKPYQE